MESELHIFHKTWKWVVADGHILYRSCGPSVRHLPAVVPGANAIHLHNRNVLAMCLRLRRHLLLRIVQESFPQWAMKVQVVPISPEVQRPWGSAAEIAVPDIEEWEMVCVSL